MTFCSTKSRNLPNVITKNAIWAYQKTEPFDTSGHVHMHCCAIMFLSGKQTESSCGLDNVVFLATDC